MTSDELSPRERENRALRRLQYLVRLTERILRQQDLSLTEAVRYVEGVRRYALSRFPGKESAWTIIYQPRFERILRQRWNYVPGDQEESLPT